MKLPLLHLLAAAAAVSAIALDPRDPWCTRVGQPCWKNKRAAAPEPTVAIEARAPEANADPWCTRVGQPCWKNKVKREAGAEPAPAPEPTAAPIQAREAEAAADPWCTRVGQPCWKNKV